MKRIVRSFSLCLLALLAADTLLAWGVTGHRVVGRIAENHLDDVARQELKALMGHESLPRSGTWADEIRSDPAWRHAEPWHFISINDDESLETVSRSPDGDILEALGRFSAVLRDRTADPEKRRQALRFLVHFIGDIHQPLHVGRREDRGGNRVDVHWMRKPSNLHRVWDSDLIDQQQLSFSEYAEMIDHPSAEQIRLWQAADFSVWAMESYELRSRVYDIGDGDLGWDYKFKNMALIEKRMLQAGVRLAGLLNDIFSAPTEGNAP